MYTPIHDEFSGRLDSLNGDRSNVFGPELGEFLNADRRTDELGDEGTKTGTTTVGIKTEEGVVLTTDMRADMGHMVSSKDVQKVEEVHPTGALTIAGSVSAAQSLISSPCTEVRLYEARRGEDMSMQVLSTFIGSFLRSGRFYVVQSILGGIDEAGPHIYSIDPAGSILEEEYTVTGSDSQYALGVPEQESEDGLDIEEAKGVATKAIRSAIERDLASGNGISIAVATEDGIDIQCHQSFEGLE